LNRRIPDGGTLSLVLPVGIVEASSRGRRMVEFTDKARKAYKRVENASRGLPVDVQDLATVLVYLVQSVEGLSKSAALIQERISKIEQSLHRISSSPPSTNG
jgi:hypothetical protein